MKKENKPAENTAHIPELDIIDLDDPDSVIPDSISRQDRKANHTNPAPIEQEEADLTDEELPETEDSEDTLTKSPEEEAINDTDSPEEDYSGSEDYEDTLPDSDFRDDDYDDGNWEEEESSGFHKHFNKINWHLVFGIGLLLFVVLLVVRFFTFGYKLDPDLIPDNEPTADVLDAILPLINEDGSRPVDDGITTIVAFGNAPFADDRNSPDNLANIIAKAADAKVYNCAVSNTYLAAAEETFTPQTEPMDAFNFYWLTTLIALDNKSIFDQAFTAMGANTPEDAKEVYETLTSIDFSTVDVITVMYDGSDYLAGRQMYSDTNPTDIQQFTGNLEAGIELLQSYFPHIRIIVMSPSYAFAVNEDGNYVSSDQYRYGQDVLSTYVIKQYASSYVRGVSFVDNLYGTITEDNAKEYLTDNIHLNVEGRKLLAERFMYALNYYENLNAESSAAE